MGLYNSIVGSPGEHPMLSEHEGIQFKWGECRLHEYRVGEKIVWEDDRPSIADNVLEISGISSGPDSFAYFAVMIDNDVISGFREIDRFEWDQLDRFEPITLKRNR